MPSDREAADSRRPASSASRRLGARRRLNDYAWRSSATVVVAVSQLSYGRKG
jgi:hypothetical protein